jgi:hypothetical protein
LLRGSEEHGRQPQAGSDRQRSHHEVSPQWKVGCATRRHLGVLQAAKYSLHVNGTGKLCGRPIERTACNRSRWRRIYIEVAD